MFCVSGSDTWDWSEEWSFPSCDHLSSLISQDKVKDSPLLLLYKTRSMASPGPHCLLPCKRPVNASSSHTGMLNWTRWTCGFYVLNFLCNRGNVEHQKYFVSTENSNILKLVELFLLIFNPSFSFPFHTLLLLPLTRIVPHSLPAVCENLVSPACFTSTASIRFHLCVILLLFLT